MVDSTKIRKVYVLGRFALNYHTHKLLIRITMFVIFFYNVEDFRLLERPAGKYYSIGAKVTVNARHVLIFNRFVEASDELRSKSCDFQIALPYFSSTLRINHVT